MNYNEIVGEYYNELSNVVVLLEKYVNSYRILIGSAGELNGLVLAKKREVKAALDRACRLGSLIDDLLDVLECCQCTYLNYVKIKSDILVIKTERNLILNDVDQEICGTPKFVKEGKRIPGRRPPEFIQDQFINAEANENANIQSILLASIEGAIPNSGSPPDAEG